jgi:hypothetical protein
MTTTTNTNIKYFKSQDIKVFPCAYRGYYNTATGEGKVFDPEARSTTEANFTSTFHKLSSKKDSYIVEWKPDTSGSTEGTLKCVIGGYYFEIYNQDISNFFFDVDSTTKSPYSLCIKTTPIDLGTSNTTEQGDIERVTPVLKSFYNTENYLDIFINNEYWFTGLALCENDSDSTASLIPFLLEENYSLAGKAGEDFNTQKNKYYKDPDSGNYIKVTEKVDANTDLFNKTITYKIDPNKLTVTSILDVGTGKTSLRMLGEQAFSESSDNATEASGDYSVALGKETTAAGECSTALGENTEATGKGSLAVGIATRATAEGTVAVGKETLAEKVGAFAAGTETQAIEANAVALGNGTIANKENQVVIGKFNFPDDTQAFIIANGANDEIRLNKFTVSHKGEIKATGNLRVNGNQANEPAIASVGQGRNDLELGTTTTGSSGSIKVYGEGTTEIFQVENSGNTTIAGTVKINNGTDYSASATEDASPYGALYVAGGLKVAKKVNIGNDTVINGGLAVGTMTAPKDAAIYGGLGVTGATNLYSTLTVTNGKTTLNQGLDVSGTTSLKNALSVSGKAVLSDEVEIKKNLQIAGAEPTKVNLDDPEPLPITHKITIGSTTNKVAGALDIYGIGTTEVFSVNNLGNTTIAGKLNISNDTTATSATTGAITVAGGLGIGKSLYVADTATILKDVTLGQNLYLNTGNADTVHKVEIGHKNANNNTDYSAGSLLIYTNAGNEGFKLDATGKGSIFNGLEINNPGSNEEDNSLKLAVRGNTQIKGNLKATSLILNNLAENATAGGVVASDVKTGTLQTTSSIKLQAIGAENATFSVSTTTAAVAVPVSLKKTTIDGDLSVSGSVAIGPSTPATAPKIVINNELNVTGINNLTATGTIQAVKFNATSDERKKTNIKEYYCEKSILDLPIKSFEYLSDTTHTNYIGCIAQDLQKICPEIVDTDEEGFLSIQENKLVYLLLQEVKKLKEKLENLTSKR